MVSEGVDIPRLAVGVYATSASTPLYFAQAIGRFVRNRRPGETASVFLPSVPHLLGLASEMELSRDHVLGGPKHKEEDLLLEQAQKSEKASDELTKTWEALSATAELDQVIFDGATFGLPTLTGSAEEEEFLGLPGLLTSDQVTTLLSKRQAEQAASARRAKKDAPPQQREIVRDMSSAERRIHLRRQLNALVAAHHHRTGLPHGKIHSELRTRCGGPPSAQATIEQLEERISMIQSL
jgi:superfamily II DNA or RNA helicase